MADNSNYYHLKKGIIFEEQKLDNVYNLSD